MQTVLRMEKKYLITLADFRKHSHYFSKVLEEDAHNSDGGYKIRSLYFDTINDKDFHEKQEGIGIRKKIRLRLYNPKFDFAMLEMKQKEGDNQKKRSIKLDRKDAVKMIEGDYSILLNYDNDFAVECYALMNMQCYKPKTIVEYQRKAYVAKENNIRITFDSNVVATESSFDIFDENLLMYPVFSKYNVILEVKYNGFLLSYIKEMLEDIDKLSLSVSKYCLARQVGLGYVFL